MPGSPASGCSAVLACSHEGSLYVDSVKGRRSRTVPLSAETHQVVQRILGHASAAMTMDLYGHLIDRNPWDAAERVGGTAGAPEADTGNGKAPSTGVEGA